LEGFFRQLLGGHVERHAASISGSIFIGLEKAVFGSRRRLRPKSPFAWPPFSKRLFVRKLTVALPGIKATINSLGEAGKGTLARSP
jgi:hypothetical protein